MGDELAVGWEASTCSSALLFILPPAAPSWGEGLSQVALAEGEEERDAQLQQWGERTFLGVLGLSRWLPQEAPPKLGTAWTILPAIHGQASTLSSVGKLPWNLKFQGLCP